MSTILANSHEVIRSRQGSTARVSWMCAWADRATTRPKLGSAHPTETNLYCSEIVETGMGKPTGSYTYEYCRIDATYSALPFIDAASTTTWEFGGEVLETAIGRTWQTAGLKCEQAFGVFYPNAVITVSITRLDVPASAIIAAVGKINLTEWNGFPAETLLFEGCTTDARYDFERSVIIGRAIYFHRIHYRFLFRPMSHNIVWRAPRQARYGLGESNAGALKWDASGLPVWEGGAAGTAGWDRCIPPLYQTTDFNALLR